ncbi:MAG TPA: putative phage abortive infection protein [Saprospiraceae bacterium]|nr:putative phage abortive infection protein [Saprospiraceae bacterium]
MKRINILDWGIFNLIIYGLLIFVGCLLILLLPFGIGEYHNVGDFVSGMVGSLWSLAGVLLIYAALKSQKETLQDQKKATTANIEAVNTQTKALEFQIKEFQLQVKELEQTRKVFEEQSETLELQRFETTFLNLLNLHREARQIVFTKRVQDIVYGAEALTKLWEGFVNSIQSEDKDLESVYSKFQQYFYVKHKNVLDPYFSTVIQILKILDRSTIVNKETYIDLFISQLSDVDKLFIFYLGAKVSPGNSLKPLIENYAVLRFLNVDKLIVLDHQQIYMDKAYNHNSLL